MATWLIQLITATLGAFCFALVFNVRGRMIFYTTLGGFLAWGSYLVLEMTGMHPAEAYLFVSIIITAYAEFSARLHKAPTTVFLVCAIIPLVPGSRLYATMVYAVHQDWEGFVAQGVDTLLLAMAIAGGIIIVSTVMHAIQAGRDIRGQRKTVLRQSLE